MTFSRTFGAGISSLNGAAVPVQPSPEVSLNPSMSLEKCD